MSAEHNILIVDDNRSMAQTLRDIVELQGYRASVAFSYEEALDALRAAHFTCLITDIRMPGRNGLELSRRVRADFPQMRVLMMTAYVEDELIDEGLAEGVVAVLGKPLDIGLLISLVTR